MKKNQLILIVFALLINTSLSFGQYKTESFEIASKEVKDEVFSIEVVIPTDYDATKKYPVIYFTDWWFVSNLTTSLLDILKYKIEPVIIVGIQNKSSVAEMSWYKNRTKNLTPTNVIAQDTLLGLPADTTGGAKEYLSFIKKELIPTVENKYASDAENRGYFGYSLGGLFGTYVLLNEPELFKKYLIGSPSLWWDDYLLSKELVEMKAENLKSINSIFIAAEEEGPQLRGYTEIKMQILEKKQDSLQLETVIILGEDHMTAIPSTIVKGLSFLYPKLQ